MNHAAGTKEETLRCALLQRLRGSNNQSQGLMIRLVQLPAQGEFMADKNISSSNRVANQISQFSNLLKETGENAGNGPPPPPNVRCKESEQRILDRQQANKSSPMQTPSICHGSAVIASSQSPSAEAVPIASDLAPVTVFIRFIGATVLGADIFKNVSDIDQLRSDIKQRWGVEEKFSLYGAGKRMNDMSQLRKALPICDGSLYMMLDKKA